MGEIGEYWRDVKADRKKRQNEKQSKQQNTSKQPVRCYDWIIVSGECHYARNRTSVKTYRPIQGTAQCMQVKGIGTVELEVVRAPDDPRTCTLLLEDVLHIPSAIRSGFASCIMPIKQSWTTDGTQRYNQSDERNFHGTDFCGLSRLVLHGVPQGLPPLKEKHREGDALWLSMYLCDEERGTLCG